MNAYPFGSGHFVKLREYLHWAATAHGCSVRTGYKTSASGKPTPYIIVMTPSGKHVIILDVHIDDSLSLSEISNYDRRLGIQWPGSANTSQP